MGAENKVNDIHPTVVIQGDVKFGEKNQILPYSVLVGPLEIGDDNIIGPHAVIGSPGQDTRNPRYDSSQSRIRIGSRNIIREFSAIQKPCYKDITQVYDDVYLMQSVHIPHDARIEDKVVITPMVVLAGLAQILEGANLGIGCSVNQYCIVGQFSLVAAGATVTKNVKPFSRYIPGQPISVNEYALSKFGFSEYTTEISDYVVRNKEPQSLKIKEIVKRFSVLAESSGKKTYER